MVDDKSISGDNKTRIFIVDDHALICYGLAQLVSHEKDMEVCGDAADVDVALQKIEETAPDLVVVDISLTSSNGIDLIKRVRTKYPQIKMLVLSMHDESIFAERALHAGAMGYMNKHEAAGKLIDAMRRIMDGHVYLSAEMTDHLIYRVTGGPDARGLSVEQLSDRELEVFELIGRGFGTRQIAEQLHLSMKTIETYREHIKDKLDLHNSTELTRHAVQWVLEDS
jgi:DNA-binding NarL/FixJ family response regulator